MGMAAKDLLKFWSSPDNTRLTAKQISIRLPVHVAAKISALAEMFPNKTKTEIIGDLLTAALEQVAGALSSEPYSDEEHAAAQEYPDTDWGDHARYERLVAKHLKELEQDAGAAQGPEEKEVSRGQQAGKGHAKGASARRRAKRAPKAGGTSARVSK